MIVAVVSGGPSAEAEVSRASARGVAEALRTAGHQTIELELDRALGAKLASEHYDVVFPVAHGAVGEDGSLQGMLEVFGVPYVGSGVLASALAMDKPTAKRLFAAAGLPLARGLAIDESTPDAAARVIRELGASVVVKPAAGGSAIAVARLEHASIESVQKALLEIWSTGQKALAEQLVQGREVTCSVLEDERGTRALAATEIRSPKDAFYTYKARYAPGRSVHECPAQLGDALTARVHELAIAAHVTLGCRDLSRVDFVVSDQVTLLEVNTMPGFTKTSLFPEAAAAAGLSFPALCDALVRRAHARGTPIRAIPLPLPE